MEPSIFLSLLHEAETLKNTIRHCVTSTGRPESVAEHSWRICLMAVLLRPQYPELDMDKVLRMCVIHDLGEAFTGDKPCFEKTEADTAQELARYRAWIAGMPEALRAELNPLIAEMEARQTPEAILYKALDQLEALISHNEAPLSSWLPLEYDLQKTYAQEICQKDPWLKALRQAVLADTLTKIENNE